jgi:hypothetical protein
VLREGKILLIGDFPDLETAGITRTLVRLNQDFSRDRSFQGPSQEQDAWFASQIRGVVEQPDGKLLVAGKIPIVNRGHESRVARLMRNGEIDLSFDMGGQMEWKEPDGRMVPGEISALALLPHGQVMAGGKFNQVNGLGRHTLVRLNGDGQAAFESIVPVEGELGFRMFTHPFRRYLVEKSSDLERWETAGEFWAGAMKSEYLEQVENASERTFYRLVRP